jgi:hypothetical protein
MNGRGIQCPRVCHLDGKQIPNLPLSVMGRNKTLCFMVMPLLLTGGSVFAADASDETMAIFAAVRDATRAIQHPLTGRGTALVEVNEPTIHIAPPPGGRGPRVRGQVDPHSRSLDNAVVDFIFKGDLSRSTRSNVGEDGRAQPRKLWAVGDKCAVTYSYGGSGHAVIERYPPLQFNRRIGYDFNPSTFLRAQPAPLPELIERIMRGPATLSTHMDADGVLHLTADHRSSLQRDHLVISVDPAKGYRLVAALNSGERFDQPDMNWTRFIEIQWAGYGSTWYVKTASEALYAGIYSWEDKPSLPVSDLKTSTVATVTDFSPDMEIDDSEFTLSGLRLPVGTRVSDRISGVTYRIGSATLATDTLEAPLAEAQFAEEIRGQLRNKDESPIDEQTDPNAQRQTSYTEHTDGSVAPEIITWKAKLAVLVALIAVAGIILILTRNRLERRWSRKV